MYSTTQSPAYIMHDQARDTVRDIMHEQRPLPFVNHPSWLAFGLLFIAVNIITMTSV